MYTGQPRRLLVYSFGVCAPEFVQNIENGVLEAALIRLKVAEVNKRHKCVYLYILIHIFFINMPFIY